MIHFKPDHDDVIIRFLHLDKFLKPIGWVRTGEVMAITGKTGLGVVNGVANYQGVYHLHIDISKHQVNLNNRTNFINPEKYNWNYMKQSNVLILKDKNSSTIYAAQPIKSEAALASYMDNYGIEYPQTEGKPDWNKIKINGTVELE